MDKQKKRFQRRKRKKRMDKQKIKKERDGQTENRGIKKKKNEKT